MSKTVMIVDDSTSMRQTVKICLSSAGYDVVEAEDGQDGIAKLDGRPVHLIIADVNMPVMGGIDMVKAIKQMPNYRFTPIMMLTTESDETRKREGQFAGAKAWVVKPFKPEQLLAAVAKLIMP
ncbi:two-component system, chemotaxis family, response regulator CheY [Formivibrio citricus]|uniref:Two-component system, chemotaxis family, response regulator CheY n=1 Tax=Formivibrio citricus TaxID=83765 RepID=A0A1I4V6D3_9NEIS|nr:response regulator [Formivibrio citricus]SFM96759.1 two-component system, chemotaxis family, response regulator CheY [Formivibrio citricus]